MPIIPPKMETLDYGRVIGQGTQNALRQAQLMNVGQQMQQRNVLAPGQLEQQGLQTDAAKVDLMVKTLSTTTDQPSWASAKQRLVGAGMPPESLPDQFDPNIRDQIIGKATGKETGFTLSPGQTRFSPTGERIAGLPKEPEKAKKLDLTPGQKKLDETFSKDYASYVAAGGYADIDKQLNQLRGVKRQLDLSAGLSKPKKGEEVYNLTGPGLGLLPESVLTRTNPEAVAARNAVEEVVQRNLRLVLGAQFTEKEGERLISRAYNPSLDEKENAKRVKRLIGQIESAAKAKQRASDYFEKNGTLKGFKGKLWTASDFGMEAAPEQAQPQMQPQTQQASQVPEGQTATNPQTGQRIIYRGGQWTAM